MASAANPAGYASGAQTTKASRRQALDTALKKVMMTKKVPRTRGNRTYSYNPKKTNEQTSYPATTG